MENYNLRWFSEATAYDLCSLHGFYNGPDSQELGCSRVWSKQDRLLMSSYLRSAQDRVEQFLGYPLTPKFIPRERIDWKCRGLQGPLKWGYVQKIGSKTTEIVDTFSPIEVDCTEVTVEVDVDFTDTCEARFFYTTEKGGGEIFAFSKVIEDGALTARFDKCSLVDPTVPIPANGLDYNDKSNFVDDVVVKRIYASPGTGASLIWQPYALGCSTCTPCVETSQDACAIIQQNRLSFLLTSPAEWVNNAWSSRAFSNCNRYPDSLELSYLAYFAEDGSDCDDIPATMRWAIIHVALADMPRSVCGCNVHTATFEEDSQIPNDIPENNFFGIKIGHIIAEKILAQFALGQGGLLSYASV